MAVTAARRFDPSRDRDLVSYAVPTIRSASALDDRLGWVFFPLGGAAGAALRASFAGTEAVEAVTVRAFRLASTMGR